MINSRGIDHSTKQEPSSDVSEQDILIADLMESGYTGRIFSKHDTFVHLKCDTKILILFLNSLVCVINGLRAEIFTQKITCFLTLKNANFSLK